MANVSNQVNINGSVGTTEASSIVNCDYIYLLKNDHGTQDLIVNFGQDTTGSSAFTLKAGEKLENMKVDIGTLYYKGSGATTTFRFLGRRGFNS